MANEITNQVLTTSFNSAAGMKPASFTVVENDSSADPKELAPQAEQPLSSEELEKAVTQLNDIVQSVRRELHFSIDDNSGRTVITVLDQDTDEVIRQIPSEQVLSLAENIESLKGILFKAEA